MCISNNKSCSSRWGFKEKPSVLQIKASQKEKNAFSLILSSISWPLIIRFYASQLLAHCLGRIIDSSSDFFEVILPLQNSKRIDKMISDKTYFLNKKKCVCYYIRFLVPGNKPIPIFPWKKGRSTRLFFLASIYGWYFFYMHGWSQPTFNFPRQKFDSAAFRQTDRLVSWLVCKHTDRHINPCITS